jgi:hypothetical protein
MRMGVRFHLFVGDVAGLPPTPLVLRKAPSRRAVFVRLGVFADKGGDGCL